MQRLTPTVPRLSVGAPIAGRFRAKAQLLDLDAEGPRERAGMALRRPADAVLPPPNGPLRDAEADGDGRLGERAGRIASTEQAEFMNPVRHRPEDKAALPDKSRRIRPDGSGMLRSGNGGMRTDSIQTVRNIWSEAGHAPRSRSKGNGGEGAGGGPSSAVGGGVRMNPMQIPNGDHRPRRGVRVKVRVLDRQMQAGGVTRTALARKAKVSRATISNALKGRPLYPSTFRAIAEALKELDPIPGAGGLIEDGDQGGVEASDG
jgi:hypothetical protein